MSTNPKFRRLLLLIVLLPFLAMGQEGIHFESGISWDLVKAKAKAENKYIFVDCYATWCGPCKFMDQKVYPQKEVGEFFNSHFISVSVQMDQTDKDAPQVRNWYADANGIATLYGVQVYPTYLFFSPDGVLRHRFSGMIEHPSDFIATAGDALDAEKQYYVMIEERKKHSGDSVYLFHLLTKALDAYDEENARLVGEDYLASLQQPLTKQNILIFRRLIHTGKSQVFSVFERKARQIDKLMGDSLYVEYPLSEIIVSEDLRPLWENAKGPVKWADTRGFILKNHPIRGEKLIRRVVPYFQNMILQDVKVEIRKKEGPIGDWGELERKIVDKYPDFDCGRAILEQKAAYYERRESWDTCGRVAYDLLSRYGAQLGDRNIDNFCWSYIFLHNSDRRILAEAVKWMKFAIDKSGEDANNFDTYANLLYKTGVPEQAIEWEKKAIDLAVRTHGSAQDLKEFRTALDKMQKGEKTWEDGFILKRPIDFATCSNWPYITSQKISNDGNYVAYTTGVNVGRIEAQNYKKDSLLIVLKTTDHSWEKRISVFSDQGQFTEDSRKFIYAVSPDSIAVLDLESGQVELIAHVASFTTPQKGDGQWLAYNQSGSEKMLVVRNLSTGAVSRYPHVDSYQYAPDCKSIVAQTRENTDSLKGAGVLFIDLATGRSNSIWRGSGASQIVFDGSSKQLAFLSELSRGEQTVRTIWRYTVGTDRAEMVVDSSSPGMNGLAISGGDLFFSEDGSELFFNMMKGADAQVAQKPASGAGINVWNYKDESIRFTNEAHDLLAVCKLNAGRTVLRLQNQEDDFTRWGGNLFFNCCSPGYVLYNSNVIGSQNEHRWRVSARPDIYLVSTADGSRTLIKSRLEGSGCTGFSPKGKYILWYDRVLNHWFAYNVRSKATRNITSRIPSPVYSPEDHTDLPDAAGLGGWMEGDSAVLIYDRRDIWKVDPDGVKAPVCITREFGIKNNVMLRLLDFPYLSLKPIRSQDTLLLTAFDLTTKRSGFMYLSLSEPVAPLKFPRSARTYYFPSTYYMKPDISGISDPIYPLRAKNAQVFLVTGMSSSEYPNLYTTRNFEDFRPLTALRPQESFNWYTSELVHWKLFDGRMGEGILYKPENFNPHFKYPILFYYYEQNTDGLNWFINPELSRGVINIPWFVSNGYLVFVPDIYYKNGYPGRSAYNSVVSAAQYFSKMPWVNAKKMGIQGHSFGGFETDYIVTHSTIFAAAVTAAGVSNAISEYDRFEYPSRKQWFYEVRQGRIGATLWEKPSLFIENSPIFKADKVSTPLLIVHNKGDGAVLFRQSSEFYGALSRLGKKVWLLSYDREQHTVDDPINKMDFSIRLGQFFNYYLKDDVAPVWMTKGVPYWLQGIDDGLAPDTSGVKP